MVDASQTTWKVVQAGMQGNRSLFIEFTPNREAMQWSDHEFSQFFGKE